VSACVTLSHKGIVTVGECMCNSEPQGHSDRW